MLASLSQRLLTAYFSGMLWVGGVAGHRTPANTSLSQRFPHPNSRSWDRMVALLVFARAKQCMLASLSQRLLTAYFNSMLWVGGVAGHRTLANTSLSQRFPHPNSSSWDRMVALLVFARKNKIKNI